MSNRGQWKKQPVTLVLLGESGSGKSASGNTILGMTAFTSKPSSMPVTTECETKTKSICGTEVTVIDTPDFFDDTLKEKSRHIMKCKQLCEGALCVYLLVIQIGRFTEGERDILERLEKALETRVRDRAIILFTRGDDLTSHIDEYVKGTNTLLKELIKNCGGRYQVFINNSPSLFQRVMEKCRKIYIWLKVKWLNVWHCLKNLFGCIITSQADILVKELIEKTSELLQDPDGAGGLPGYADDHAIFDL